jgi:hypothetical protein
MANSTANDETFHTVAATNMLTLPILDNTKRQVVKGGLIYDINENSLWFGWGAGPYEWREIVASGVPVDNIVTNFITVNDIATFLGDINSTVINNSGAITTDVLNATTENVITSNITTANITTANIITENVTTSNITTANITNATIVTENVTTSNITTANIVTENVTTSNIDTANIVNGNITNANITTEIVGTSTITTANITTANITTEVVGTSTIDDLTINNGITWDSGGSQAGNPPFVPDAFIESSVNGKIRYNVPANSLVQYNDDFLVGSQFMYISNGAKNSRMYFQATTGNGAFRAGVASGSQWDSPNVGLTSFAAGTNNVVVSVSGAAFGNGNTITAGGTNSLVSGSANSVTSTESIVGGDNNTVSAGQRQLVVGGLNTVSSASCIVYGTNNNVSGGRSIVGGQLNVCVGAESGMIGNGNNNTGARSFICGSTNVVTITGDDCITAGTNNTVSGASGVVSGDTNIVSGSLNVVCGTGNICAGDGNNICGIANQVNSSLYLYNSVSGGNNTLLGTANLISGSANTCNGSVNLMYGQANTINGGNFNLIGGFTNSIDSGVPLGIPTRCTMGGANNSIPPGFIDYIVNGTFITCFADTPNTFVSQGGAAFGNGSGATPPLLANPRLFTLFQSPSVIFSVDTVGNVRAAGTISASVAADFGEYFESSNGESIPLGTSVVILSTGKIRAAVGEENPNGVISNTAGFVGNAADEEWFNKFERDGDGNIIMETVEEEYQEQDTITQIITDVRHDESIVEGVKRYDLVQFEKEISIPVTVDVPVYHNGELVSVKKDPVMITKTRSITRRKISSSFDPEVTYIPRSQRPEWNIVGLLGVVKVLSNQVIANSWIQLDAVPDTSYVKYFIR